MHPAKNGWRRKHLCACVWPGLQAVPEAAEAEAAEAAFDRAQDVLRAAEPGPELRVDPDHVGAIRQELVRP